MSHFMVCLLLVTTKIFNCFTETKYMLKISQVIFKLNVVLGKVQYSVMGQNRKFYDFCGQDMLQGHNHHFSSNQFFP